MVKLMSRRETFGSADSCFCGRYTRQLNERSTLAHLQHTRTHTLEAASFFMRHLPRGCRVTWLQLPTHALTR